MNPFSKFILSLCVAGLCAVPGYADKNDKKPAIHPRKAVAKTPAAKSKKRLGNKKPQDVYLHSPRGGNDKKANSH